MPKPNIQKILLRAPNWIGDAVLCLPALETLKAIYPQAEISVLAKSWVSPVFFNNRCVKRIIDYDAAGRHRGMRGKRSLIQEIKGYGFDMAVLFQNAFEAALITFLSGIPIRIGYSRDLRGLFLTHPVQLTLEVKKAHQVFYYLHIVAHLIHNRSLGFLNAQLKRRHTLHQSLRLIDALLLIEDTGFRLEKWIMPKLYLSENEKGWANTFLEQKGFSSGMVVGIAPGASYGPAKRWRSERFSEVAKRLIEVYGAKIILFGGKNDRDVCTDMLRNIEKGLNLAGGTDLRQSIAILNRCNLLITNDSGPMHLAASMGVPTIAIFGSSDANLTGPLGDNVMVIRKNIECSPCFKRGCKDGSYKCMELVTVDDVHDMVSTFMNLKSGIHAAVSIKSAPSKTSEHNLKSAAVFLDRDGTINEDTGYIDSPERLIIMEGASSAIKKLNLSGFKVVIITNQSGVGRGYFSKEVADAVNKRLEELLKKEGVHIDGIYYCPHHPDDNCECRKPKTELLKKAQRDLHIDLKKSYVVGDKVADVELAHNISGKGILVLTGKGMDEKRRIIHKPSYVAHDVKDAVEWILNDV